jgi:hypothetical protein
MVAPSLAQTFQNIIVYDQTLAADSSGLGPAINITSGSMAGVAYFTLGFTPVSGNITNR